MIPNKTDVVEVSSSIEGTTQEFTVDENSLGKIMSVLTNLYTDPEQAVVREYLTNALDAQIEAQEADPTYVWRPIEVTTPSMFSKEYKVRDFGPGMNESDLKEIYSKYGKSTKESSQSVTGMLGLGSKCALTYTNQFTITGWKGGVRTRAVVSKDENDIPVFMIVDTRATTEPNGVEVSVPVRDRNSFAHKTAEFLRWWKDGQVLVDGAEPAKHSYASVKTEKMTVTVGDKSFVGDLEVFLAEREQHNYRYEAPQSYVVMGNVPYKVDSDYVSPDLRNAYLGFVAYVPMGAVDFPPSREELRYNVRTKKCIGEISNGLFESILDEKLKEVTDAPTHKEAWVAHASLPNHFSSHPKAKGLKYKGIEFASRIQHDHMTLDWDWQGHGQISDRQWLDLRGPVMNGALIVTDVATKPTSYFKKKVNFYIEQEGLGYADAILVKDDIDNVWLNHLPRIDAEHIKSLKLPKDGGAAVARAAALYDIYTVDSNGQVTYSTEATVDVPKGYSLTYISPQDIKETYHRRGISATSFAQLFRDTVVVITGKNRHEKLVRTYPNAIKPSTLLKTRVDTLIANVTDAEYLFSQLDYSEKEFFKACPVAEIKDPELVAVANMVKTGNGSSNYATATNVSDMAARAGIRIPVPERKTISYDVTKRYPLIESMGARKMRHLLVYINAMYELEYASPQVKP